MIEQLRTRFGALVKASAAEIRQHPWVVASLVFLSAAQVAPYLVKLDSGYHISKLSLFLALGLTLVALVHRYSFFVLCVLLSLANLVFLHLDRRWGARDLQSRIEASFESFHTYPNEVPEYLRSQIDSVDIGMFLVVLAYVLLLAYMVFVVRPRFVTLRKVSAIALILWTMTAAGFRVDRKQEEFPPYDLFYQAFEARQRFQLLQGRREFLAQHPLEAKACKSNYDRIVIVLGESAAVGHMSLFGYKRTTTPFADRSQPYAFEALAPSNQTRFSIPMMLTGAGPGDFERFYREPSLVSQLRACGFGTTWISNQGRLGNNDSFITSIALEADEQIFLNQWKSTEASLDERIVSALREREIHTRRNHATFVHLIGSHVQYEARYPAGFGFPDPSDRVTHYDNTILYTDQILSELYEMFRGQSSLFVYVSDHGQVVSDSKFGVGFLPAFKEEYRVPLLIWTTDAAAIGAIRLAAADSRINAQSLDDIVRFLAGLSEAPNVSTTADVSVLLPERVQNHNHLQSFGAQ